MSLAGRSSNINLFYNLIKDQYQNPWLKMSRTRGHGDVEEPAKNTKQEQPERQRKPGYGVIQGQVINFNQQANENKVLARWMLLMTFINAVSVDW